MPRSFDWFRLDLFQYISPVHSPQHSRRVGHGFLKVKKSAKNGVAWALRAQATPFFASFLDFEKALQGRVHLKLGAKFTAEHALPQNCDAHPAAGVAKCVDARRKTIRLKNKVR
jgi:hypothetical protein